MMAGERNDPDCLPILEKIEDPERLLAQIVECIDMKDTRGLKTYILEHKLRDESLYWDLILKIGEKVTAQQCEEETAFFDVCNRCLVYLVKMGKPKEMLLAILEQMDTFIDDIKYKCFLPLLQMSLFKISAKLFHSLDIALETVSAHIRGIQMPENVNLEGEERKLYHLDTHVVRIVDNLETFLEFLEPFVKSVSLSSGPLTDAKKNEALVLKKHLVRLFTFPLNCLDLTYDNLEKPKTNSRLCVEKTMELLSDVETNFHRLIASSDLITDQDLPKHTDSDQPKESMDLEEEDYNNSENERKLRETVDKSESEKEDTDFVENWDFQLDVTKEAQACLAYVVHTEHLGADKNPQVYSHDFMFEFHLQSIAMMLKNTFYPINYKGLLLCKALVDLVRPGTYGVDSQDNPHFMTLINDLIHTMIKCPVRDHRVLATSLFTTVIKRFQEEGRYQIYQAILSSCLHSGVKGFVITILKDDVSCFLRETKETQLSSHKHSALQSSPVFSGLRLMRLISLATSLPDKETSDMLENSDCIISALNFLRFLVVADPHSSNRTGFWSNMSEIKREFLSPLRLGLDMSQAHYKLELQTVQEGKSTDDLHNSKMDFTLSAAGADLPRMEKGEKINLIERALNTHQLMISLLCRLTELIEHDVKHGSVSA